MTPVGRSGDPSLWWIAALAVLLVAYAPLLEPGTDGATVLLPLGGTFLAILAWGHAARRAAAMARAACRAFQGAAAVALLAYLAWGYQTRAGVVTPVPMAALHVLPDILVVLGAALVLGRHRGRTWNPRLAADALLFLLVATAGALRLVVEPALAAAPAGGTQLVVLTALRSVAVVPVLLAALIVLRRGALLAPWAGSLLLAAATAFALAALLTIGSGGTGPALPGEPAGWVDLGGWILLAAAGFAARRFPPTTSAMLAHRKAPDALRRLLVPAGALFLAAAVVDLGLGPQPRPETVLVVALLGVALAIRTAQALSLADRDSDRRRQLAHTRALVDVTHALAGTTDLDATLRVISESARGVFGTRAAGIELLSDDGERLETRSAVGLPPEVLGLRFPLEGSFTGWVVRHGKPRATVDPSSDPYIQPQSLRFLGRWPVAAAPIQFRGETLGALFACIRTEPFDAEELELMGALAEQAAIAIQNARLFERISLLSVTDPLTGLANRRQLELELEREFAAALRGRPLTAVIFDLDDFKAYNDAHGHIAGDEALQAFAGAMREESRAMDLAARYGGDEFVGLLGGTGLDGGHAFVERVRAGFAAAVERLGYGPLSASAGVAEFAPDMDGPEALLRAADDALYRSKPHAKA